MFESKLRLARAAALVCALGACDRFGGAVLRDEPHQARGSVVTHATGDSSGPREPVPLLPEQLPPPPPRHRPPRVDRGMPAHLQAEDGRVDVYPPEGNVAIAPLTVMLHGMCMDPSDVCEAVQSSGRQASFLVCPAGNVRCGDAFDWGGPTASRTRAVEAALEAVDQAIGEQVNHDGDILVGYSRGAFLARDYLLAHNNAFHGVVFLGAAVEPPVEAMRAAGIRRAVFACGDYDGAKKSMQRGVAKLRAGGIEARFVSLGRMGHGLPRNIDEVLQHAYAWIREPGA